MTNPVRWLVTIVPIGLLLLVGCGTLEVDVVSPTVPPSAGPLVTQVAPAATLLPPPGDARSPSFSPGEKAKGSDFRSSRE
ncbi:MAG: hypothetical protein PVI59_18105 [Anaerolineae bacterium]